MCTVKLGKIVIGSLFTTKEASVVVEEATVVVEEATIVPGGLGAEPLYLLFNTISYLRQSWLIVVVYLCLFNWCAGR